MLILYELSSWVNVGECMCAIGNPVASPGGLANVFNVGELATFDRAELDVGCICVFLVLILFAVKVSVYSSSSFSYLSLSCS